MSIKIIQLPPGLVKRMDKLRVERGEKNYDSILKSALRRFDTLDEMNLPEIPANACVQEIASLLSNDHFAIMTNANIASAVASYLNALDLRKELHKHE